MLLSADDKLAIFEYLMDFLLSRGYVYIGMDHILLCQKTRWQLHKVRGNCIEISKVILLMRSVILLAWGLVQVGDGFSQNEKNIEQYYQRIDAGELSIIKGQIINQDDKIRRLVTMDLICYFEFSFTKIEQTFNIVYADYFADNLSELSEMAKDGLLEITNRSIKVMDKGQLLIRNICMMFDVYLALSKTQFSKII